MVLIVNGSSSVSYASVSVCLILTLSSFPLEAGRENSSLARANALTHPDAVGA